MFPLLGIILAFLLGLAYPAVVPEPHAPDLLGAAAVVLLFAGAARIVVRRAVHAMRGSESGSPMPLIRASFLLRVGTLVAYAAVVYGFHWPQLVRLVGIDGWVLLPELLILLPFFAMLVIALLVTQAGESELGVSEFRRGEYLAFHLRQYLLPLIPVLIYIILSGTFGLADRRGVEWVADLRILYQAYPFLQWITLAALLFVLYCFVPFLLRIFWRAKPLPPGPLRDRLTEFSRREGFKARELLVWPTGGHVMNAAVIGVAGPFRYVLITDGLLDGLPEDEVEAVFAHEVGHAKHNHMLLFFLFTIGYALLAFLVNSQFQAPAARWLGDPTLLYLLFAIGGFLLWFGIVFGFVSRRFEQQADVYGVLATGRVRGGGEEPADPAEHPFVRALEGLAEQMGDIREVKGWRHFSLGERIDFLKRFLTSEETRRSYRRGMRTLLVVFFSLLIGIGIAAASTVPEQIRRGRFAAARATAAWLQEQGRHEEAMRESVRANELAREAGIPLGGPEVRGGIRERTMRIHDRATMEGLPPPDRTFWLLQLAQGYLLLDQPAAARTALTQAMILAGDQPGLLALLGRILQKEGRPAGARLAYRDALAGIPPDSRAADQIRQRLEGLEGAR